MLVTRLLCCLRVGVLISVLVTRLFCTCCVVLLLFILSCFLFDLCFCLFVCVFVFVLDCCYRFISFDCLRLFSTCCACLWCLSVGVCVYDLRAGDFVGTWRSECTHLGLGSACDLIEDSPVRLCINTWVA